MAKQKYTEEYLIETLKDYAVRLNRTPTYKEFEDDSTVPSATVYKKRFGTWNNALKKANLVANAERIYTKEQIIATAWEFYRKNGRSPFYNEFQYSRTIILNFWKGWTEFLLDIGIPPNYQYSRVTSKSDLLIFLKELSAKLEKIPSSLDVEEAGVNRNLYLIKFGSFKNALIESKVVSADYFEPIENRVSESLKVIKDFYDENTRPPTVAEYEKMAKIFNLAHRKALEDVLNKRYTEICIDTIGEANQYKRNKDQLLEELKILKDLLGRTPRANELISNGLAEKKQYYRTFNMTYTELIDSLGWELSSSRLNFKTEEELLEDYQKLFEKIGRLPYYKDIDSQKWMSSSSTYKKYFGDLPAVWKALDIEIDLKLLKNNYGMGLTCIDKNNDVCRSIPEMIISNILIDLNLKFEKEYSYKKVIPKLKKNYRFDWVLLDYPIVIEYFGLFSEEALKHENVIGKYSRKVLEKINLCEENNVLLIDLYLEDLENIEEILIRKLNRYILSI